MLSWAANTAMHLTRYNRIAIPMGFPSLLLSAGR
jgi:hypothetical protein